MDNSKAQIKVFSTPSCSFCKVVKGYLHSLNIQFEDIDLTEDQEAVNWLVQNTGQAGVPVTLFNDSEFIVGWQKEALDEQLRNLNLI